MIACCCNLNLFAGFGSVGMYCCVDAKFCLWKFDGLKRIWSF